MRSELTVIALLFGLASPFLACPGFAAPEMPKEVEVVMDSNEASVTPAEGGPLMFPQHGVVIWNISLIPSSVLEVRVELLVIGLGLSNSIAPQPIILSRADPEFDFELTAFIPQGFPTQDIEYTIQGYYEHTAYPADRRALETVDMVMHIAPYSLVSFREISDGDQAKIGKNRWETIEVSLWNQGNADDTFIPSIECISNSKVRYDDSPIKVHPDEFRNFEFEVYAQSDEPAVILIHVDTEHQVVNNTGEMVFTLYVDETNDLLNRNFNVLAGSIAAALILFALIVAFVVLRLRRKRSSRPPRGQG